MDLIDRKRALEEMTFSDGIEKDGVLYVPLRDVNKHIRNLPSAQPEIIRCKECRYSEYDSIFHSRYCHNKGKAEMVGDDFFCAAGRYQTNGSD